MTLSDDFLARVSCWLLGDAGVLSLPAPQSPPGRPGKTGHLARQPPTVSSLLSSEKAPESPCQNLSHFAH